MGAGSAFASMAMSRPPPSSARMSTSPTDAHPTSGVSHTGRRPAIHRRQISSRGAGAGRCAARPLCYPIRAQIHPPGFRRPDPQESAAGPARKTPSLCGGLIGGTLPLRPGIWVTVWNFNASPSTDTIDISKLTTERARVFRRRASEFLKEVQEGRTLEVTAHGQPVARLVPVRQVGRRLLLAERGRLTLGVGDVLVLGAPLAPARDVPPPSERLARSRAAER